MLCLARLLATSLSAVAAVSAAFASFFGHETTTEGGKTVRENIKLAPTHCKKSGLVAMGRSLPCSQATAILLLLHDDLLGWALLILHLCFHRVSLEPSISSFFQVPLLSCPAILPTKSRNSGGWARRYSLRKQNWEDLQEDPGCIRHTAAEEGILAGEGSRHSCALQTSQPNPMYLGATSLSWPMMR